MIRGLCDDAFLRARAMGLILAVVGMFLTGAVAAPGAADVDEATPLKIGLLLGLSSGLIEVSRGTGSGRSRSRSGMSTKAVPCSACP